MSVLKPKPVCTSLQSFCRVCSHIGAAATKQMIFQSARCSHTVIAFQSHDFLLLHWSLVICLCLCCTQTLSRNCVLPSLLTLSTVILKFKISFLSILTLK